jgi:hypothetical protein
MLRNALTLLLIALLVNGFAVSTFAQTPSLQRSLEMELEPIDGATAYEIELKSQSSSKTLSFKMTQPLWKAKVKPGIYDFRLRAYDDRGVPGEWSALEKFVVNFSAPTMLTPQNAQEIKSGENEIAKAEFKWSPVPNVKRYKIYVESVVPPQADPNAAPTTPKTYTAESETTEVELSLPVATQYKWSAVAIMANGTEGDRPEQPNEFMLLGAKLESPTVEKPYDKYVYEIKWNKPDNSNSYDYILQRKDESGWKTVEKKNGIAENQIDFSKEHPGGQYRIAVRAKGPLREASALATTEFKVHVGDRSPAAVQVSRLRESMDKPTSWYAVASYLITNIDYTGIDAKNDNRVVYSATGGTGRLGLGYFKPGKDYGFIGILDLSGINVSGENVQYSSLELHYARKLYLGTNKLLLSGGLFSKELPETSQNATGQYTHELISYAGPHAGLTFWHPFSPKLGLQLNLRAYFSMFDDRTPNGAAIENEMTTQLGAMGSLRLSENLTGFAGIASRVDRASYKKSSGSSQFSNQEVELKGNYLNLLLEYGF